MTREESRTVDVCWARRREQRVALEHLELGRAEHRQLVEVVHHHHRVEAACVGFASLTGDRAEEVGRFGVWIGEVGDLVAELGHALDDTTGSPSPTNYTARRVPASAAPTWSARATATTRRSKSRGRPGVGRSRNRP